MSKTNDKINEIAAILDDATVVIDSLTVVSTWSTADSGVVVVVDCMLTKQ